MNLLNEAAIEEYKKRAQSNQSGFGAGIQRKTKKVLKLTKRSMVSEETSQRVFPLDLTLPFNPADLTDDTYDVSYRYVMPNSVTTAWITFKAMMAADPNLKLRAIKLMGLDESKIDFTSASLTPDEFAMIKRWRMPRSFSAPVFSTKFSNRKDPKYSIMYMADCVMDEDGKIDTDEDYGLFYKLHYIENACCAKAVEALRESFQPGGINAHRSEKERKDDEKDIWSERLISRPFYKYVLRYMHIVVDTQTNAVKSEIMDQWKAGKISDIEAVRLTGLDAITALGKQIGGPKDVHADYIVFTYTLPEIPKGEKNLGPYAQKISMAITHPTDCATSAPREGDPDRAYLTDFDVTYRAYLDDPTKWNDSVIKNSIREFNTISDAALLAQFELDIGKYQEFLKDESVVKAITEAGVQLASATTGQVVGQMMGAGSTAVFSGSKLDPNKYKDQQDLTSEMGGDVMDETTGSLGVDDINSFLAGASAITSSADAAPAEVQAPATPAQVQTPAAATTPVATAAATSSASNELNDLMNQLGGI